MAFFIPVYKSVLREAFKVSNLIGLVSTLLIPTLKPDADEQERGSNGPHDKVLKGGHQ